MLGCENCLLRFEKLHTSFCITVFPPDVTIMPNANDMERIPALSLHPCRQILLDPSVASSVKSVLCENSTHLPSKQLMDSYRNIWQVLIFLPQIKHCFFENVYGFYIYIHALGGRFYPTYNAFKEYSLVTKWDATKSYLNSFQRIPCKMLPDSCEMVLIL